MKYKKLKVTTIFILLSIVGVHAQEVLSSLLASGGEAKGGRGKVSYSVGQLVHTIHTGTNNSVSHGVQQFLKVTGINGTGVNPGLSVYPNPTRDLLILSIEDIGNKNWTYQLYDIQGKLLKNKRVTDNSTIIIMKDLPASIYLLKVRNHQQLVKSFKIIKR